MTKAKLKIYYTNDPSRWRFDQGKRTITLMLSFQIFYPFLLIQENMLVISFSVYNSFPSTFILHTVSIRSFQEHYDWLWLNLVDFSLGRIFEVCLFAFLLEKHLVGFGKYTPAQINASKNHFNFMNPWYFITLKYRTSSARAPSSISMPSRIVRTPTPSTSIV